MNIALWIVQVLLGLMFIMAGGMKLTADVAQLGTEMAWAAASPAALIRFIGLSELLGGIGLIAPSALRIAPKLTPLAAALLALVMVLAIPTHLALGEGAMSAVPAVLGGMCAFVAWGRLVKAPIEAR